MLQTELGIFYLVAIHNDMNQFDPRSLPRNNNRQLWVELISVSIALSVLSLIMDSDTSLHCTLTHTSLFLSSVLFLSTVSQICFKCTLFDVEPCQKRISVAL